jgi:hypothetical protein
MRVGRQSHAPSAFPPGKRNPVPILQKTGCAPGRIWTDAENLVPNGIRSADCPAYGASLYRLRYPSPPLRSFKIKKVCQSPCDLWCTQRRCKRVSSSTYFSLSASLHQYYTLIFLFMLFLTRRPRERASFGSNNRFLTFSVYRIGFH